MTCDVVFMYYSWGLEVLEENRKGSNMSTNPTTIDQLWDGTSLKGCLFLSETRIFLSDMWARALSCHACALTCVLTWDLVSWLEALNDLVCLSRIPLYVLFFTRSNAGTKSMNETVLGPHPRQFWLWRAQETPRKESWSTSYRHMICPFLAGTQLHWLPNCIDCPRVVATMYPWNYDLTS